MNVRSSHIFWKGNKVADALANHGTSLPEYWFGGMNLLSLSFRIVTMAFLVFLNFIFISFVS